MAWMNSLWCECGLNMVTEEGSKCSTCQPKPEPSRIDFSTISVKGSIDVCPVSHCACTKFTQISQTSRTLDWECVSCSWVIRTDQRLRLTRSSPTPTYGNCRQCDSEAVIQPQKNGTPRTSWACPVCSYTTRKSQEPFYTDGYYVVMTENTSLSFNQFQKRNWNRIPKQRRAEIVSGINVSEEYSSCLEQFIFRMDHEAKYLETRRS